MLVTASSHFRRISYPTLEVLTFIPQAAVSTGGLFLPATLPEVPKIATLVRS